MYGNNAAEFMQEMGGVMAKDNTEELEKEKVIIQLMDKLGTEVLRTAFLYVKNKSLAEDIFQEVFIKVYKHLNTYRSQAAIKTWIIQITINQCKDHLKSKWFKHFFYNEGIDDLDDMHATIKCTPEDLYIDKEKNQELLSEVLKLSIPLREALILHYYHSYSEKEIASILSISQGTVRSRLHRAKAALRSQLEKGDRLK